MHYSYTDIYQSALSGPEVVARGLRTREILGGRLVVPADVLVQRPGLNRALGYMELLQLVAGVFDLAALKRVAPKTRHELFTPQMAYGPRTLVSAAGVPERSVLLQDQLEEIYQELRRDSASRRAVLSLIDPRDSLDPGSMPCTNTVQFLVRPHGLYTIVTMRSWDLWWGLPYDLVIFNGVAQLMARCLRIPAVTTQVNAGSAHIYGPFWGKQPGTGVDFLNFEDWVPRTWPELRQWAKRAVANKDWVGGPPAGIRELTQAQWVGEYVGG